MLGKGLQPQITTLLAFFLWLVKSLKNVNNRIAVLIVIFFFSMVLGVLDQLQILLQFYLVELPGLLTSLGLLKLLHLIYSRLSTEFCMLVFFTNVNLMEFQVRYLTLFLHFSVIAVSDSGSLHKNNQLMLEFLKGPFLVLYFFYYTLMIFLMMLSVILLSVAIYLGGSRFNSALHPSEVDEMSTRNLRQLNLIHNKRP